MLKTTGKLLNSSPLMITTRSPPCPREEAPVTNKFAVLVADGSDNKRESGLEGQDKGLAEEDRERDAEEVGEKKGTFVNKSGNQNRPDDQHNEVADLCGNDENRPGNRHDIVKAKSSSSLVPPVAAATAAVSASAAVNDVLFAGFCSVFTTQ